MFKPFFGQTGGLFENNHICRIKPESTAIEWIINLYFLLFSSHSFQVLEPCSKVLEPFKIVDFLIPLTTFAQSAL